MDKSKSNIEHSFHSIIKYVSPKWRLYILITHKRDKANPCHALSLYRQTT